MLSIAFFSASLIALAAPTASTDDFTTVCHASSSFDLTVAPDALSFERADPLPHRVVLRSGKANVDGAPLRVNAEDADRLALFDQDLRTLVPKAKAVAVNGVDLAISAVRAEAAGLGLDAPTRAQLDDKLAAHATDLKRRIANTSSTRDWQGAAFDRYVDDIVADIVPVIASDLGSQAIAAALVGDLDSAAALRDRASRLSGDWPARLQNRMRALRPQVQALCPSIRRLYELQSGVRDASGRPLALLDIEKSR